MNIKKINIKSGLKESYIRKIYNKKIIKFVYPKNKFNYFTEDFK